LGGGTGSGGGSSEALELGLQGREELVGYGMDVFVFFFEPLSLGICECEEEANCSEIKEFEACLDINLEYRPGNGTEFDESYILMRF